MGKATPQQEQKIIDLITPVFRSVFEDDKLVLNRALNASMVENWDSLNHITLVVELEQITGAQFTSDELASMADVGGLIDCLAGKGVGV
jgi:acyl carrier protein